MQHGVDIVGFCMPNSTLLADPAVRESMADEMVNKNPL
jgi:hypothetical protein